MFGWNAGGIPGRASSASLNRIYWEIPERASNRFPQIIIVGSFGAIPESIRGWIFKEIHMKIPEKITQNLAYGISVIELVE